MECNVASATANIEYAHAGADPRLSKELSRYWLDEAALHSQTLKLVIRVTERVDCVIHSCSPAQARTMHLSQRWALAVATGIILRFSQRVKGDGWTAPLTQFSRVSPPSFCV